MTETAAPEGVNLYIAADGLTGRGGGPYLDQEERRVAEERRAVIEGREPDLDHPSATAGTVLVNASQLVDTAPVNVPSSTGEGKTAADTAAVNALVAAEDNSLEVAAVIPPEAFAEPEPEPKEETPAEETPAETPAEEDPFAEPTS